jgi:hypothetical protein
MIWAYQIFLPITVKTRPFQRLKPLKYAKEKLGEPKPQIPYCDKGGKIKYSLRQSKSLDRTLVNPLQKNPKNKGNG